MEGLSVICQRHIRTVKELVSCYPKPRGPLCKMASAGALLREVGPLGPVEPNTVEYFPFSFSAELWKSVKKM
jgi:hypothetical protein